MISSASLCANQLNSPFVNATPLEASNISARSSSTWQSFKDKSVECLSAISSFAIRVGSAFLRALQSFLQIMINPFVDGTVYNRAQALEMVRNQGSALCLCSDALKDDKDVVLLAVANLPSALLSVSNRLLNDRDVILTALRGPLPKRGSLLVFASEALRGDREVVAAAVTQSGLSLQFASEALWSDRGLVLEALRTAPHLWDSRLLPQELKADTELKRLVLSLKAGLPLLPSVD